MFLILSVYLSIINNNGRVYEPVLMAYIHCCMQYGLIEQNFNI